jgi:hypothetical protein
LARRNPCWINIVATAEKIALASARVCGVKSGIGLLPVCDRGEMHRDQALT